MKNALAMSAIILALILTACSQQSMETSMWRGPNGDGIYPDKGLLKEWPEKGPELLTKIEGIGQGYASPIFTATKYYITGMIDSTGYVYCYDNSDKLLWKKGYGLEWTGRFPGTRANVTVAGEKGYLLSSRGLLLCFNTKDGEEIWSIDLMKEYGAIQIMFGLTEVLLIDGDVLYCTPGGEEHNVIALDRHNGELIWTSEGSKTASAYGIPTIFTHGGKNYLSIHTALNIMALHLETGEVAWRHPMVYQHGIHANSPIYKDGHLFVLDGWNAGSFMLKIAEDGNSVEQVWTNELMDLENGDAILIGDNLYGTNYKWKGVSCVDWKTGKEKFTNKDFVSGTLLYADGLFYLYGVKGEVALMKAHEDKFEVVSWFQLGESRRGDHSAHPVINNKKLYLRYDTDLYVYDVSI